jgi:hypothetical protein
MIAARSHKVVCTVLMATALASAGCVDAGSWINRLAQQTGFQNDVVTGSRFRHRVYRNEARAGQSRVLHVYIEGDGRPFLRPTTVAFDPTPRDPLMLRLMALDAAPSVYLGRPCYFGLNRDRGCNAVYWTVRRFAPEVVDSMADALRSEAARSGATSIEIFGHSGGGTLAVLLSARIPGVTRVVTIGANLDIDAWCALHGYSPLLGSLNPAELNLHPRSLRLLHLVGSDDTNTPPALVKSAASRTGTIGSVHIVRGYTHNCCWQEIWGSVLSDAAGSEDP